MNALILGSMKEPTSNEVLAEFKRACSQIGEALAVAGHTLMLMSANKSTADRYVAEGAANVNADPRTKVIVHYSRPSDLDPDPDDEPLPFANDRDTVFRTLDFVYRNDSGHWGMPHMAAIRDADVLIVVGGRRRCDLFAHAAQVLGKPILALPLYPGIAQKLWTEFSAVYRHFGLTESEKEQVSARWTNASAATVVAIAERLVKTNPFHVSSESQLAIVSLVVLSTLAALAAVFGFTHWQVIDFAIGLILIIALAAFLGTSSRTLIGANATSSYRVSWARVLASYALAVLLACLVVVVFLTGKVVLQGTALDISNRSDFLKLELIAFIIGFVPAFIPGRITDLIVDKLSKWLV